ncbi:EscU/YscU/HrcU family type III secretion system export apparatus switch protein [Arcobacter roscoffensis]|uniref:EscU/YscU/HrcU family type III secretion system export apparatus switch protein n=1 Tax=Arcobacter roscoffensis TaxID=2961520 RepID=A0ABY5E3U8_9BACT|nr:EscU/YscU/HrcU family type III secretion system export apparatus switch protein [Arcobacter roscoffensis]UTJ05450.1 EscU/YscU/HrcU family type III secretion system export apparatus switch protein [Arcobacter roscoffensis]
MQKDIKQENYTPKAAALKYDIDNDSAPKITAKGKGETANNIIKIARENDIPIKKDEDLIELLSQLDLDKEIPASMYKAVAEIFSFIYDMTNQGKKIDEKLEERLQDKD